MSRRADRRWPILALSILALMAPAPASAQDQPFTLVALPDTQHYTCTDGSNCVADEQIFELQTEWIAANRDPLDIRFVTGLGDCVQDGDDTEHFVIADEALRTLEAATSSAFPDGIPYGLAVGNRDQFPSSSPGSIPSVTDVLHPSQGSTTEDWNSWFGVERYCPDGACRSYYGDHFGLNNDNHYDLFDANGYRFVVVHVEFMETDSNLRQAVIAWADEVLDTYADRRAIVVSHYVMKTGTQGPFSDQGSALYHGLKEHPNLFLILGGHITGEGRRADVFEGRTVHTVLSDYQGRSDGGEGWLRLLEFRPAEDLISVRTWSPWLDEFETDSNSQFTLAYEMDPPEPEPEPEPCEVWPDLDADGVCNPSLDETPVIAGRRTTLTITNAEPGSVATFLMSRLGEGGPTVCSPGTTVCTSLRKPITLGTATVGDDGEASIFQFVALAQRGNTLHFQATWVAGSEGQVSEVDRVLVQ